MLVRRVAIDCDQDTLLYFVEPLGPACHTGQTTCFYQTYGAKEDSLPDLSTSKREKFDLNELFTVIAERKHHPKPESYTNKLFNAGEDEILKKVGEEAVEVILAAKSQGQVRLIEELADWVYHMLVLMAQKDLTIENLFEELANRHNLK
jgi:phosphoribosyl-ATP pyrophosphohydrolase/phosphoribosyl-AMP cyclohydrolase